jgi:hypothetical protein
MKSDTNLCLRDVFVIVSQQFFGVAVGVVAGLAVVEEIHY